MTTFGLIGVGNMGGALARALCKQIPAKAVTLADRTPNQVATLAEELGCRVADNDTIARHARYIFLGVKPQMMEAMLTPLIPVLQARQEPVTLITMAAGVRIERICQMVEGNYPVIRIMPNTPVSIGEGMILYCNNDLVSEEDLAIFLDAMSCAGRFAYLPEQLIDAGSAVSGCGPAFVDLFVEALADGGVACGLPRARAVELAAQMVAGSAKLILESGKHPGELKDAVCSPGGTTVQGIRKLEEGSFRGVVMNAVIAAYEKNFNLM